ncbi:MAG: VanZ family protein [Candidatus Ancaeobacter aquaticus]|nr:VanZ family protein [Candidatus Ancaeobacter aquaticus]
MKIQLPKITLGITLLILASSFFAAQLSDALRSAIGFHYFYLAVRCIIILLCVLLIIYNYRERISHKRCFLFSVFVALGLIAIWFIKNPVERLHLLEFGLLGWFAYKELALRETRKIKKVLYPLLFIVIIGVLDEVVQHFIPYRVGEMRDSLINIASGLWGIILCVLFKEKRYCENNQ